MCCSRVKWNWEEKITFAVDVNRPISKLDLFNPKMYMIGAHYLNRNIPEHKQLQLWNKSGINYFGNLSFGPLDSLP